MMTASWSSWTPGREGGALRGVIDDIADKGTHRSGERVWRCAHRHTTEATAHQCAAAELKRRQTAPTLNWSQRVTMRMISDGRSPSGGSSYLDTTGLGIPGGTIRSLNRRGLIERYSWTEPGWVLTKAGVDAINSGACDEPDPDA
jgi:hypothetical protein